MITFARRKEIILFFYTELSFFDLAEWFKVKLPNPDPTEKLEKYLFKLRFFHCKNIFILLPTHKKTCFII